jgi:sigma-B regulation protein RsbU (phosphoserine phosphatase)
MTESSPELIRSLDALSRQALQLQISGEVGRQVTSILDLDELLPQVVSLVQSRFGYQVVSVWLLSEQGDCVSLRAVASLVDAEFTRVGACLPLDQSGLIVSVCKTRAYRLANDVRLAPDYLDALSETRAELALPLQVGQDIIGVMDIQCTQTNTFNEGDVTALQIVADQVATAIRNARLYQDAQREKRYLGSLVQNSPVAIVATDLNGNVVSWNPAAEELFGYTQAEAIGRNLDPLITKTEDLRAEAIIFTQQTTGGTPVHSITLRYRKDGSAVDVEVSGVPMLVESKRVGAFVLYHDISLANNYIARHHWRRGMMFATLFFGVLDAASGVLTYVNAGHPSPIMVGPSGARDISARANPALGLVPQLEFIQQQVRFEPGDIPLAYTDGATEALNAERESFSKEQLLATLQPAAPTAAALLERVESSVRAHAAGEAASDDTTMLAVRRAF